MNTITMVNNPYQVMPGIVSRLVMTVSKPSYLYVMW